MGDFSSLEVFTETAVVGGTETHVNFAPSADANSVSGHVGVANGVSIRALNLAEWLQNECAARHPRLPIVLRMDIEAQEYMVLMDLVLSGAPRTIERRFNSSLYLAVEWHRYKKHEALGGERCALMNKFDLKTRFFNRGAGLPPRGVDPYLDPNWKRKLRNKRCVTLNVPSRNTNHPLALQYKSDVRILNCVLLERHPYCPHPTPERHGNVSKNSPTRHPKRNGDGLGLILSERGEDPQLEASSKRISDARRRHAKLDAIRRMTHGSAALEENYEKILMYLLHLGGVHVPLALGVEYNE